MGQVIIANRQIILFGMSNKQSMIKVNQISFSQDYSRVISKNTSQKVNRSVLRSSSLSDSKPNSPFFNKLSNKRLKYYSKRHKESITTLEDAHLQTLKQEFIKFDDNRMKSYMKINPTPKREAINLIAKKYYTLCKTQSSMKISNSNLQTNNQNLDPQKPIQIPTNIQVLNTSFNNRNKKLINISTLTPVNPFKNNLLASTLLHHKINLHQNSQHINHDSLSYPKKLSISSTKSNTNKILVTEQRLSRHRFTKSSISRISHQEPTQNKIDNFLTIDLVAPSMCLIRPSTPNTASKRQKNQFRSLPKPQTSKRYVKGQPSIKDELINPYTNKTYLHVQLQVEKKQLKRIQRIIQKSDASNVKQSFQVKTINPETNTILSSRTANKTFQQEFMRKVKNLGTNVRKQLKNKKRNHLQKDNQEIHGWEIDNKSVANEQIQPI